ncbi:FAD-dependent oxidoreductase [Actinoplanes flavus]|uniref:FAD-dependent monooxygenase n=1 Tax=Actinoplanes flavus TaxID=2820290 RepID=A0ABS3URE4_9ACTN|nr:NAD(P)/FAD-dependent oxidoreductase [Actinoplanes flavus]MBO3741336.1 FAD-dependent monooxygenase [Actinoplanes flavus]
MTPPTDTDVVVCGAGVAGLAAARALGRLGLRVTLIEKKRRQPPVAKGEVLQPGSLDILDGWDVLHRLESRDAVRLDRLAVRTADGHDLATMDFTALDCARPWMLAHDYTVILDCLEEALGSNVRRHRGVLAEELMRDGDGRVTGVHVSQDRRRHSIRARLVVAADGMSSRLRRLAGLTAEPVAYGHKLLSFELTDAPAGAAEVSAHITRRGLVMVYPLPHRRTRVYVQVGPDELRGMTGTCLKEWCDGLVADVPVLEPLTDALQSGLAHRQVLPVWRYCAASLVGPGFALVGEAAHGVHPLSAQGMNTAIGDAHDLANRLAGIDAGRPDAVDGALLAYQHARARRIKDVHVMSHNAARMITQTSWAGRLLGRRLLSRTGRNPRLSHLTAYNMSGLGMRPLNVVDRLVQLGALPETRGRSPMPLP